MNYLKEKKMWCQRQPNKIIYGTLIPKRFKEAACRILKIAIFINVFLTFAKLLLKNNTLCNKCQ